MSLGKRILNQKWIVFLMLFALFPPQYLFQNNMFEAVHDILKYLMVSLITVLYFVDIKRHLKKRFNLLLFTLWLWLLLSTLMSDEASIWVYVVTVISTVVPCFLMEEITLYSPYNGLKSLFYYLAVCVIINTVTVILFPNGMYANNRGAWVCWFLGEDNIGYVYYIMASIAALLYVEYIAKKVTVLSLAVWVSSFIFVFHNDIATGIICQLLWLILVLGYKLQWFKKLFLNPKYALYITLLGFVFGVLNRKAILKPITDMLGRNITLTGRTLLWDRVLERIAERPIYGFGICDGEKFDRLMLNSGLTQAHNLFLMFIFSGGIIAAVILCLLIYSALKIKKGQKSAYYLFLVIGLIMYAVRFLVEGSNYMWLFSLLAMLAYSNEFKESSKRRVLHQYGINIGIRQMPRIKIRLGGQKS